MKKILFASAFLVSQYSISAEVGAGSGSNINYNIPLSNSATSTASTTSNSNLPSSAPTITKNVGAGAANQATQAANNDSNGMNMGMIASAAGAAIFGTNIGPCMSPAHSNCPEAFGGLALIPMGMSAAGNHAGAMGGANSTYNQVTGKNRPTDPNQIMQSSPEYPKLVKALDALKSKGVSYDPKTNKFKLPNGKELDGNALAKGDLSGTGLSPADQAKAMGVAKDALKDAAKDVASNKKNSVDDLSLGDEAMSGGGGAGRNFSAEGAENPFSLDLNKKGGQDRKPTSVAGLSKIVNGEAVGVAADSLFDMMKRKYNSEGKKNNFELQK